jgi:hypothetical protein
VGSLLAVQVRDVQPFSPFPFWLNLLVTLAPVALVAWIVLRHVWRRVRVR